MKTHTIYTYKFGELPEGIKEKAVENLYDINMHYDWWEYTYEDAENIGLKITAFDLGWSSYVEAEFMEDASNTAHLIMKNHGNKTETYRTAISFLTGIEENEDEFLLSLCEDYRMILQREYDYLTSEEAIIETIKANDYDFTEDGKLY